MKSNNQKANAVKPYAGVAHAEKYHSGNWIADKLVRDFMGSILSTAQEAGSRDIHEVGCGEGHILAMLAANDFIVRGCDISQSSLAVAAQELTKCGLNIPLKSRSIYELDPEQDAADTVLCCEVLEHLTNPEDALGKLLSVTRKDLILSVPNEPIWHILNMSRGKYWSALGNTPGHFQHWSRGQFVRFVGEHAEIVSVKTPLPWTLIHCRPHHKVRQ